MELNFDTGVVEYNINGKYTVRFNPTDTTFIQRLSDAFDALEAKQKTINEGKPDKKDYFRIITERDKEVREILDGLFGAGMCDAVFSDMSMHALAGGLPVWMNFILAIIDKCDGSFLKNMKDSGELKRKYSAKYAK